jgi:hypothetical protein
MAVGTYFFDTATFANASTVYTDQGLTLIAPDGFYSDDIIVREQITGKLQVAETCDCSGATPTPTPTVTPLIPTATSPTATPPPLPPTATAITPEPTVQPNPPTATPPPVTEPIAGFYYRLEPCVPCNTTEIRYMFSLTALTNNQRYLEAETGCYYTYKDDVSYPPLVEVRFSLIINPSELAGETLCPPVPTGPPVNNYIVSKCTTNIRSIFSTTTNYNNFTRMGGASGTYQILGTSNDANLFPTVTGLQCVDDQGRLESNTNFSGCASNCPDNQSYFTLNRCNNPNNANIGSLITMNTAEYWEASPFGYQTGDVVYAPSTGKCYTLGPTRTGTGGADPINLNGSYKVQSCYECSNFESPDAGFEQPNTFTDFDMRAF